MINNQKHCYFLGLVVSRSAICHSYYLLVGDHHNLSTLLGVKKQFMVTNVTAKYCIYLSLCMLFCDRIKEDAEFHETTPMYKNVS